MSDEKLSPLAKAADDISKMRDLTAELAKQSPDVKAGKCTVEDELNEPTVRLFDGITKSVVSVFEDKGIAATLKSMTAYIPEDAVALLMNLLAVCSIQCSYRALVVYDDLLKEELKKTLDPIIERLNSNTADVTAYASAIRVFKKSIGDLETKMKLYEINKTGEVPEE